MTRDGFLQFAVNTSKIIGLALKKEKMKQNNITQQRHAGVT